MAFSVAIRTIAIRNGSAEAGAGGGIVWDSRTTEEFREVRRKAQFLIHPPADFRLVETFLLTTEREFRFLSDHLRRLAASARYFGYRFRREAVLSALHCAVDRRGADGIGPKKVRLLLAKAGDVSVEVSPIRGPQAAVGTTPLRVTLSDVAVSSRDPFVRHKTTNRALRDEELRKAREAGGVREGLCRVSASHITAWFSTNDDEGGLHKDYARWLEEIAPQEPVSR